MLEAFLIWFSAVVDLNVFIEVLAHLLNAVIVQFLQGCKMVQT